LQSLPEKSVYGFSRKGILSGGLEAVDRKENVPAMVLRIHEKAISDFRLLCAVLCRFDVVGRAGLDRHLKSPAQGMGHAHDGGVLETD
jgi:hypothetical protein